MLDWYTGGLILGGVIVVAGLIAGLASKFGGQDAAADAWNASFADPRRTGLATQSQGKSRGIYLGTSRAGGRSTDELWYPGDRSIMTVGPNGSGKSRRALYPNLMRVHDHSMVVVDPKGDLLKFSRDERARHGSEIIVLDPFGITDGERHSLNPIAQLDPESDDFLDDAMFFAEAMVKAELDDPHWGNSAQDMIAACIMAERLAGGCSFTHIRDILSRDIDGFKQAVDLMIAIGNEFSCLAIPTKLGRYTNLTAENREMMSVLATAITQTRWLDSPPMQRHLAEGAPIDFTRMRETPITVFIVLPPNRLETHSVWVRLVVASILRPLLVKPREKDDRPVLFMLDEYPALAAGDGFPAITRNMAMFRGYGIKLWTAWQDLNQARRIYGDFWESFAANAGVLQALQPQDVYSAEYLSQRTGLTTRSSSNWSFSGKQPQFSGSEQGMPLMLPQAVRDLGEGETLIFTHIASGPVRGYLEYPEELAGL